MEQNTQRRKAAKTAKAGKGGLIALCVVAAVIIIAAVLGIASAFSLADGVCAEGIMIAGYDCSGKTKDEIVEYLSTLDNPYEGSSVTVTAKDSDVTAVIGAADIDLKVDAEKTAEAAVSYVGRNIFKAMTVKISKKDIGYTPSYDHIKLDSMVNDFARAVGGTLVQHEVNVLETEITVHAGTKGLGIDTADLKEKVVQALKPASNETVSVSKVNTNPADINIEELYELTKREPQDARYAISDGNIVVEKEVNGREFDIEAARKLLKSFAPGSPDVSIPFIIEEAKVKSDLLSMALFGDVLGSYSTKYMISNAPRANNVELAAKYINGKILLPGDEFSYNGTVGKRSAERGFKAASVYENNKMVDGLGGGICQTSSTLYAAVLYADLEVTERHEHSLEVSYAPLGMDATVAYGSLDFRFKNNTDMPIKISTTWGGGTVGVKILGTKADKNRTVKITTQTVSTTPYGVTEINDKTLPVGKTVVDSPGFKGAVVNTYKIIYENGVEVENKFLHKSTYTMVNKVVRVGSAETAAKEEPADVPAATTVPGVEKPDSTPTPSPSSSPDTASPSQGEKPQMPEGL